MSAMPERRSGVCPASGRSLAAKPWAAAQTWMSPATASCCLSSPPEVLMADRSYRCAGLAVSSVDDCVDAAQPAEVHELVGPVAVRGGEVLREHVVQDGAHGGVGMEGN